MSYFPEPYARSKNKIKVELDKCLFECKNRKSVMFAKMI